MCHGHTAGCASSGQSDQVFRSDVGGKEGGTDCNPGRITTSQEIITRTVLLLIQHPDDDTDQGYCEQPDDNVI